MTDCPTACLVDFSEPDENNSSLNEDKENSNPLSDSIEVVRGDDTDRRNSITICKSLDTDDQLLHDVTDQSNNNNNNYITILDQHNIPEDTWLDKETFDFDLILSPAESKNDKREENEEEIFFGPMGFTERCVAAVVAAQTPVKPMSPLNPKQLAEMIKEAHGVACLFSNMKTGSSSDDSIHASPQNRIINARLFAKSPMHFRSRTFSKEKDIENINPSENHTIQQGRVKCDVELLNTVKQPLKNLNINGQISGHAKSVLTESTASKPGLKPKYSRLPKSRSASNLPKAVSSDESESVRQRYKSGDSSTSDRSITSDTNDVSISKLPAFRNNIASKMKAPSTCKRLQPPMIKPNLTSFNKGRATSKLTVKNVSREQGPIKTNHTRTNSNSSMESISSQSSSISSSSFLSQSCNIAQPIIKSLTTASMTKNASKGPLSKLGQLKLVRPSLQKKAPVNQSSNRRSLNGPIKAVEIGTKTSAMQNRSFAEYKPKADVNTVPICTPVKQEKSVQRKRLSTTMGTLGKSSSVSSTGSCGSVTQSTPTSNRKKRHSLLPTPSKSRPSSSGSIPPSPLSCRSSNSSVNSWLGASLSDATDSPVFEFDKKVPVKLLVKESPSTMKPNKKLVQNTPDVAVKKPSRWSPIVRRKVDPNEQALHCTKRIGKH